MLQVVPKRFAIDTFVQILSWNLRKGRSLFGESGEFVGTNGVLGILSVTMFLDPFMASRNSCNAFGSLSLQMSLPKHPILAANVFVGAKTVG